MDSPDGIGKGLVSTLVDRAQEPMSIVISHVLDRSIGNAQILQSRHDDIDNGPEWLHAFIGHKLVGKRVIEGDWPTGGQHNLLAVALLDEIPDYHRGRSDFRQER